MAFTDGAEQRREPRKHECLIVTISGRDKRGHSFTQNVVANSISGSGALLSGITSLLRAGDLIWVEHAGQRYRFKVVWVRDSESSQLIQAAVQLMNSEQRPWSRI